MKVVFDEKFLMEGDNFITILMKLYATAPPSPLPFKPPPLLLKAPPI